jgi:hypothetical protein
MVPQRQATAESSFQNRTAGLFGAALARNAGLESRFPQQARGKELSSIRELFRNSGDFLDTMRHAQASVRCRFSS